MKRDGYELLSVEQMKQKYGLTAENRPSIHLNPKHVPEQLRHLIPYAEFWGVGDDLIREDMVEKAPPAAIDELRRIVADHDDLLDQWLAGPESSGPNFSKEYTAFSAMRMAADLA